MLQCQNTLIPDLLGYILYIDIDCIHCMGLRYFLWLCICVTCFHPLVHLDIRVATSPCMLALCHWNWLEWFFLLLRLTLGRLTLRCLALGRLAHGYLNFIPDGINQDWWADILLESVSWS